MTPEEYKKLKQAMAQSYSMDPWNIGVVGSRGASNPINFNGVILTAGDRVILIDAGPYGNGPSFSSANPQWGLEKQFISGLVKDLGHRYEVSIEWENGQTNVYHSQSGCKIALLTPDHLKQKEAALKPKEVKIDLKAFESLVLDASTKEEILSVLKQFQNRDKMFNEWGLGEVIEYGKGMSFLFYGPPGTGKTWAAHCISKATGFDLLTISAAEIESSEPGAANRNIQAAFAEATKNNKILFIDECDSLISSRQDVGMILGGQINSLLTEIEKFEGVTVLATNRIENLDEALERRISLIVEFPSPDEGQRAAIWSKMLPKKMPISEGVDPIFLAKHVLTGGQIKNCVLAAARLALSAGKKVVDLDCFTAAIERVQSSKNLMGQASRYRQVRVRDDYKVGRG